MSIATDLAPAKRDEDQPHIGIVTRSVSWVLDALAINLVAIMTGLGAQLVLSLFPVGSSFASVLKPIAAGLYVIWACAYFVVFWSWTGQTLGARIMQIRQVKADTTRVRPARAVVRWVGMNLAMLPLFAGFAPILFGRRAFPDWLARTAVLPAPQLSLAEQRRATIRQAGGAPRGRGPAVIAGQESSGATLGGGGSSIA